MVVTVSSVNIGAKQTIKIGERVCETGIYKLPRKESVLVSVLGLESDAICDERYHGGCDQAVYIYRVEDYTWWSKELRRDLDVGTFGENLTISGIETAGLMVGDRLHFDDLCLEVTAPRIPCGLFASRMGDAGFAKAFVRAERPGFYCRVITTGRIQMGQQGRLEAAQFESLSTVEFYRDAMQKISVEKMSQYLALPIDVRSRKEFERKIEARRTA